MNRAIDERDSFEERGMGERERVGDWEQRHDHPRPSQVTGAGFVECGGRVETGGPARRASESECCTVHATQTTTLFAPSDAVTAADADGCSARRPRGQGPRGGRGGKRGGTETGQHGQLLHPAPGPGESCWWDQRAERET